MQTLKNNNNIKKITKKLKKIIKKKTLKAQT